MINVIFIYKQKQTNITAKVDDKLKDICQNFASKIRVDFNQIYFISEGKKIENFDKKLNEYFSTFSLNNKLIKNLVNDNPNFSISYSNDDISLNSIENKVTFIIMNINLIFSQSHPERRLINHNHNDNVDNEYYLFQNRGEQNEEFETKKYEQIIFILMIQYIFILFIVYLFFLFELNKKFIITTNSKAWIFIITSLLIIIFSLYIFFDYIKRNKYKEEKKHKGFYYLLNFIYISSIIIYCILLSNYIKIENILCILFFIILDVLSIKIYYIFINLSFFVVFYF